jgi:hypothetical protein
VFLALSCHRHGEEIVDQMYAFTDKEGDEVTLHGALPSPAAPPSPLPLATAKEEDNEVKLHSAAVFEQCRTHGCYQIPRLLASSEAGKYEIRIQ